MYKYLILLILANQTASAQTKNLKPVIIDSLKNYTYKIFAVFPGGYNQVGNCTFFEFSKGRKVMLINAQILYRQDPVTHKILENGFATRVVVMPKSFHGKIIDDRSSDYYNNWTYANVPDKLNPDSSEIGSKAKSFEGFTFLLVSSENKSEKLNAFFFDEFGYGYCLRHKGQPVFVVGYDTTTIASIHRGVIDSDDTPSADRVFYDAKGLGLGTTGCAVFSIFEKHLIFVGIHAGTRKKDQVSFATKVDSLLLTSHTITTPCK